MADLRVLWELEPITGTFQHPELSAELWAASDGPGATWPWTPIPWEDEGVPRGPLIAQARRLRAVVPGVVPHLRRRGAMDFGRDDSVLWYDLEIDRVAQYGPTAVRAALLAPATNG